MIKTMRLLVFASVISLFVMPGYGSAKSHVGEEVIVRAGTEVEDAVAFGDDVIVYGTVNGDAVSLGGNVEIKCGGIVKQDIVSLGGDTIVRTGGKAHGDLVSVGGEVDIEDGAEVCGDVTDLSHIPIPDIDLPDFGFHHGPMNIMKTLMMGPFIGFFGSAGLMIGFIALIIKLAMTLAIVAILTYLFPGRVSRTAGYIQTNFPKALLMGLVFTILIPIIVLMLIVTIIGIPIVPVFIVLLFIIYFLGSTGIALWCGRIIPESEGRSIMVNALLGAVAVGIVKHIPIIGGILGIAFWMVAIGSVVLTRFGRETI